MEFKELNIAPFLIKALNEEGYTEPTPIQSQAIPKILSGQDLLGCAQTGTGKTAAFAVPTLQLLCNDANAKGKKKIRALIITPTRELAMQIYESFCVYGKYTQLKACVIFGGVSQRPQETQLRNGVDILVATPGRLNDLLSQNLVDLSNIEHFILDEADRMLDMGFLNDVKKIISKIPKKRQTLLFSATMPPDIAKMADTILVNPAKVSITPVSSTVDAIEQRVYYVDKRNKKDLLLHLLTDKNITSALVFTRTKHGADSLTKHLVNAQITAQAIHGNKSQGARQLALNNFKTGKLRVLVATDIAARGIDIDELSHVVNYDLPNIPETYVHRIGRTGRAGLEGVAISFCDFDEKPFLADIVKLIGKKVPEVKGHPHPLVDNFPAVKVERRSNRLSNTGKPSRFTDETSNKHNRSGKPSRSYGESANKNSRTGKPNKFHGESASKHSSAEKSSKFSSKASNKNSPSGKPPQSKWRAPAKKLSHSRPR